MHAYFKKLSVSENDRYHFVVYYVAKEFNYVTMSLKMLGSPVEVTDGINTFQQNLSLILELATIRPLLKAIVLSAT